MWTRFKLVKYILEYLMTFKMRQSGHYPMWVLWRRKCWQVANYNSFEWSQITWVHILMCTDLDGPITKHTPSPKVGFWDKKISQRLYGSYPAFFRIPSLLAPSIHLIRWPRWRLEWTTLARPSALIQHEWRPKSFFTISADIDIQAVDMSAKVGLAFALEPW